MIDYTNPYNVYQLRYWNFYQTTQIPLQPSAAAIRRVTNPTALGLSERDLGAYNSTIPSAALKAKTSWTTTEGCLWCGNSLGKKMPIYLPLKKRVIRSFKYSSHAPALSVKAQTHKSLSPDGRAGTRNWIAWSVIWVDLDPVLHGYSVLPTSIQVVDGRSSRKASIFEEPQSSAPIWVLYVLFSDPRPDCARLTAWKGFAQISWTLEDIYSFYSGFKIVLQLRPNN